MTCDYCNKKILNSDWGIIPNQASTMHRDCYDEYVAEQNRHKIARLAWQ